MWGSFRRSRRRRLAPYVRMNKYWADLRYVIRVTLSLVESNLPLAEGLKLASQDAPSRGVRVVLEELSQDLNEGVGVAVAMGCQRSFFPPYTIDLVAAGEVSGSLDGALRRLDESLEEYNQLRSRMMTHGYYFANLLLWEGVLLTGLSVFVVPQFVAIFGGLGQPVDPMLHLLDARSIGGYILPVLFFLPVLLIALEFSAIRQGMLYRTTLGFIGYIPFLSLSHRKRHLGDGCAMIALLCRGGIPLPDAIRRAAEACPSFRCRRALYRITHQIEEGESLKAALERESGTVPQTMIALLSLSEHSGRVPEGFAQVGTLFGLQARRGNHLLLEVGGPVLLCLVGVLVFVYYSTIFMSVLRLTATVIEYGA